MLWISWMADDYEVEERMMLKEGVETRKLIGQDVALNDIVIGREDPQRGPV